MVLSPEELQTELWNVKLDKLQDAIDKQGLEVREINVSLREFTVNCNGRHQVVTKDLTSTAHELRALEAKIHGIFWTLGALFSAVALAFFTWIFGAGR